MRIRSLEGLMQAVQRKKAVTCPSHGIFRHRPLPAAWVINLSGAILNRLIIDGLFIYEPKAKRRI